jgi:CHAT domain-containing protein
MFTASDLKTFRIVVYEDGIIRVQQIPENGAIPDCQIAIDDLQQQTLQFLIKMLRNDQLKEQKDWQLLGMHLYKVLLDNEIGRAINKALYNQALQLVRVELEFKPSYALGDLASWPWEYVYCPLEYGYGGTGYFLTKKTKLLLIRHLSLDLQRSIQVSQPPVRVLFVAANPDDLPPVMHESVLEVLQELQQEVGDENVVVYSLVDRHRKLSNAPLENAYPNATFNKFVEVVDFYKPHVIHLIAHGQYQPSGSQIALMGQDRQAHWIGESELSEWLANNDSLRLVFLQSCESALSNSYEAVSGFAKQLAHHTIPAVIGMQYQIQTRAANLFAKAFYQALTQSLPIDVAVQKGRKQMSLAMMDWEQSHAFGLPVLYLSKSQPLFEKVLSPESVGAQGIAPVLSPEF